MEDGHAYFGYALCPLYSTKATHTQSHSIHYYCLGVCKCYVEGCPFLQQPKQPQIKKMGAPPKEGKYCCPKDPDQDLELIACTGNSNCKRKLMEQPYVLIHTYIFDQHVVIIKHSGHHNHPRPPVNKLSPAAQRLFETVVKRNPDLGPQQLQIGGTT